MTDRNEITQKYIDEGMSACPHCGSGDFQCIEGLSALNQGGHYQEWQCSNCEGEWREIFRVELVEIELTYDPSECSACGGWLREDDSILCDECNCYYHYECFNPDIIAIRCIYCEQEADDEDND